MATWLAENKLSLNVTKTQSLLIGSHYKIKALERLYSSKLSLSSTIYNPATIVKIQKYQEEVNIYDCKEHNIIISEIKRI